MISRYTRRIGVVVGLALAAAMGAGATSASPEDTVGSARRVLVRLPYYGVFDFIAFRVDRGVVTLGGYSYEGNLKADTVMAVKRASGVDEVLDSIEPLPVSGIDDRIRWATFFRIYADDFLSRYAPGGPFEVIREFRDERRFPGMEPVGIHPIHIIVRNSRTMLRGAVTSASDRQLAEVRAREVEGVFEVDNALVIETGSRR